MGIDITKLLEPDVLATDRYFWAYRRKTPLEPEKALMFAVLKDGIEILQKFASAKSPRGRTLFQEAASWIRHENDDWLFSFRNVCDVLGLDPSFLRRKLLER